MCSTGQVEGTGNAQRTRRRMYGYTIDGGGSYGEKRRVRMGTPCGGLRGPTRKAARNASAGSPLPIATPFQSLGRGRRRHEEHESTPLNLKFGRMAKLRLSSTQRIVCNAATVWTVRSWGNRDGTRAPDPDTGAGLVT